jgi:hypothetical protein
MDKNLLQQMKFICCNNAKQRRVYYCKINGQPIGTTKNTTAKQNNRGRKGRSKRKRSTTKKRSQQRRRRSLRSRFMEEERGEGRKRRGTWA